MKKIAIVLCLLLSACDQGLSVKRENVNDVSVDRKCKSAENNDGDYTFYFKNGQKVAGDCDGYTLKLNGKTTVYEYFKAGINEWERKLLAAGIPVQATKTSNPTKYCSISFDTSLLKGVGVTDTESSASNTIYKDGKSVKFESKGIKYLSDGQLQIWLYGPAADKPNCEDKLGSIGIQVLNRITGYDSTFIKTYIESEGVFFHQNRNTYW